MTSAASQTRADPANCQHIALYLGYTFDTPQPIVCRKCLTRFETADAVAHIVPLRDAFHALDLTNRTSIPEYPCITMAYGVARIDDDEGSGRALPDLDIDMGHITELDASVGLGELIIHALHDLADVGKYPPLPRSLEQLQQDYPKYAGWTWKAEGISITECLEKLVA